MIKGMSKRRKLFILAAILSGISVFLPLYYIQGMGVVLDIPKDYVQPVPLIPTISGILALIAAILIVVFAVMKNKIGYVISTIADFLISMIGLIDMSQRAASDPELLFDQIGNAMNRYSIEEVRTGPGFFIMIVTSIFVLGMMIFNLMEKEEEE